jgi:S-adenosylmethionine-diacylglycerol 3-amino-3-carboxypropyl transferase
VRESSRLEKAPGRTSALRTGRSHRRPDLNGIDYSQCWEDTDLLLEALRIERDDAILSVASGGDNSLALLPSAPSALVLIDKSPPQLHLTELKLKAPLVLNRGEYHELLGVTASDRLRLRVHLERVLHVLSDPAATWWNTHQDLLDRGIIECGKFERYLTAFRRHVLPLVHTRQTICKLLQFEDLQAQRAFYEERWRTWRWKAFLRLIGSRTLLRVFARQTGQDQGYDPGRDANYGARLESLISRLPLRHNFYVRYIFLGDYGAELPDYLGERTFRCLAGNASGTEVRLVPEGLYEHLKSTPADTYSKFNLSDLFEGLSADKNDALWEQILRTAKNGARIVYWCNQVERHPPARVAERMPADVPIQRALAPQDRLFFYRSFNVRSVGK